MFERYTEKARRAIFFAHYDASQYGSYYIDTEHLLLGLMRENFPLLSNMMGSGISAHAIQQEIEKQIQRGERFSTAVEVPLSVESKRAELCRGGSGKIGTAACWHRAFALGLLREENALAAVTLRRHGAHLAEIRLKLAGNASRYREPTTPAGTHYSYRLASKPARSAMDAVSSFLSGLKSKTSPDLADFFADNGQFIDASGKIWFGREEIKKEFERLFAAFSKKNTSYRIEKTISERQAAVLVSVLWENAVHTEQTPRSVIRMTILLVPEDEEWAIFLMLIAPVAGSLA
jgi:uncharacterized protein (TIGR02246 family)